MALESITSVANKLAYSSLALLCVEEAESKLCDNYYHKTASDYFSLFVAEPGDVKVERCSKHGIVKPNLLSLENNGITTSSLDEMGAYEVEFR
ncbi:hypothetical protein TorRG33x02_064700 [Trema orientale]|uniref:Uncharacterized protein n=1 Tax=Trema orientale TaxID=63057 RepID=A0A2P5FJA8_TREOI|nr:hypothetical protein TorRG33x02_064700 [Trema orientale]